MNQLSDQALQILHEWVQSESLRKHCYAVSDCMRHFAELNDADADLWQAVGLLHDMDYERHPNARAERDRRAPVHGGEMAARARLERRGLPGDSLARELHRRRA